MADLLTLGPEEFQKELQSWLPSGQAASPIPAQDDLANLQLSPDTRRALEQATSETNQNINPESLSEANKKLGIRPGVPFNLERGAPAKIRAALSFDEDKLNQYKLLSNVYGQDNVAISDDSRFVIRNQINPTTGTKEDFLVNPVGLDWGDVASLSGDVLPLAAAVIGQGKGAKFGSRPVTKALGGLTGMALGQEATTAAQQEISRLLQGQPLEPGTLAGERTKSAIADVALGGGMALGVKGASKLGAGMLGALGIRVGETPTEAAAKELAKQTGVNIPLTPGETLNSGLLLRAESAAKPRIGTVGVMSKVDEAKQAAQDELRRVFLGLPRTLSDDDLAAVLPKSDITGQQVLKTLGEETTRLKSGVQSAKDIAQSVGSVEAQTVAGTNLNAPISSVSLGERLRAKAVGDLDTFKTAMAERYNAFEANPLVSDRVVSGDVLAKAGKDIERNLFPQAVRTSEVPFPIVGPKGQALTIIKETAEPIDSFVAASARRAVNELKGLEGARIGISDMKRIRTSIDNSIAEGVAIPGTDVKQLISLREKVTDAIRDSLGKLDPKLLKEWDTLNTDYAQGMSRFNTKSIKPMLIPEGEPGSVGNAQLARAVGSGSEAAIDKFNDFKKFYGATSPEFQDVKRLAREQVLRGSPDETTGFISGQRLRSNLRSLDPEVSDELFGQSAKELHKIGAALEGVQGNLDINELRQLAANGTLTARAIPGLIQAERERATAFANKLIKAADKGVNIDTEVIKPSEVVRSLISLDPKQAQSVLGILHAEPALLEDVRKLAVEELWGRVQANSLGQKKVTTGLIQEALGDDVQKRTWKLLLGPDVVSNLETLSKVLKPQELSMKAFKSAGSLGATTDIAQLERGGFSSVLGAAAERMLLSVLYTGPLKNVIVNLGTPLNQGRILNGVIASTPFIEAVVDRFGENAPGIMSSMRRIVEPKQQRQLELEGKVKGQGLNLDELSPDEFNLWLQNAKQ